MINPVKEVVYQGILVRELENGSIEAKRGDEPIVPVKPILRELAVALNISLLNSNGNALNTRQLGSQIIKSVQQLFGADSSDAISSVSLVSEEVDGVG